MSLKEDIDNDLRNAIKSKNQDELRALRAIKSMILLAESEKGNKGSLSKEAEMKLLMKAVKQRKDSATLFMEQGRNDLYEKETTEMEIIQRYLPKQLSEGEVEEILRKIISDTGASDLKDMGRIMGVATQTLAGQADGKTISILVKKLLSQ